MLTALSADDGAMILFDFAAACPRISRHFLHKAAQRARLPLRALRVIESFYHRRTSQVMIQGCTIKSTSRPAFVRGAHSHIYFSPLPQIAS
jgi:hypothetical protein